MKLYRLLYMHAPYTAARGMQVFMRKGLKGIPLITARHHQFSQNFSGPLLSDGQAHIAFFTSYNLLIIGLC
jgi:hypothetical protein